LANSRIENNKNHRRVTLAWHWYCDAE